MGIMRYKSGYHVGQIGPICGTHFGVLTEVTEVTGVIEVTGVTEVTGVRKCPCTKSGSKALL